MFDQLKKLVDDTGINGVDPNWSSRSSTVYKVVLREAYK